MKRWLACIIFRYLCKSGLSIPIVLLIPKLDQQYTHTCLERHDLQDVCLGCREQFPDYLFGMLKGHPLASYTVEQLLDIIPKLIREEVMP